MPFTRIIGQDRAVAILQGSIRRQRIASAYLFCGESGIGKKLVALNFAKALNCLSTASAEAPLLAGFGSVPPAGPQPSGAEALRDACETCISCEKINAGTHPDLFILRPDKGTIKIGQIRPTEGSGGIDEDGNPFHPLEEFLKFSAYEAARRFVIVEDADLMNDSASNAFLKTLEEPPADTIIILVSSRPNRLLPTIRSRCSRVNFRTLSAADCAAVLRRTLDSTEVEAAARLSMGRPGLAAEHDITEERNLFLNLFQSMLKAERDSWASREDMERWFDHAAILLRDLAVHCATGRKSFLINQDLADQILRMGKSVDLQGIIDIYQELLALKGLLTFNPNKSITWNYAAALLRGRLTG